MLRQTSHLFGHHSRPPLSTPAVFPQTTDKKQEGVGGGRREASGIMYYDMCFLHVFIYNYNTFVLDSCKSQHSFK